MSDAKLIADTIVEFQEKIENQREIISTLMKESYRLNVEKAKEEKKLEKINQIIDSADIKTWGESSIVIRIREVLEQE